MSLWDQMKWSLRHSKRQFLESLLVVVAIALGVGVIITILSMFLSIGEQYRSIEENDHFRTLEVLGKNESTRRDGAPLTLLGTDPGKVDWNVTLEEIAEFQENLPFFMHAYVERHWSGETPLLAKEDDSDEEALYSWYYSPNQLFIMGTLPEYFAFNGAILQNGNFFLAEDVLNSNQVIVIPHGLAEDLYGETDPLGQVLPLTLFGGEEQVEYTVIGVLAPEDEESLSFGIASRMAYAPITVSPYGGEVQDGFGIISVGIDVGVELILALELVTNEASLLWGDQIAVRSSLVEFRQSQAQTQSYALLIGLFASVGLVIAVINILNLMLARVLKRTKSIGLSMALGSSRQMMFRQFMLESITLGLTGSIFGTALSFAFGKILERTIGAFLATDMWGTRVLLGIAMGLAVSLFFGVYPAHLGSRINPVDALRTD